ncbi:SLC13 family permease [Clostridiaceae bacterium M8S5]|nr:SLC13 family permease [Clostridiaceae bacterium M8S5]
MLTIKKDNLIKILFCFGVMIAFNFITPPAPITALGMKVLGIFIGSVLLISLVDTTWPSILCIALFAMTGVMNVKQAISSSLGSWVTMFVLLSFILTHALNETGFTKRITCWLLSKKFITKSPWVFTISLLSLALVIGCFLDPLPVTAFFLMLAGKLFKEFGYKPGERYPQMLTMALVFTINIAGGMTPISHPLAIIGMGVYNKTAANPINFLEYCLFAIPAGLIVFSGLILVLYLFFKPDFEKFKNFNPKNVIGTVEPMKLREKITVTVFFITAFLWLLPGILGMICPGTAIQAYLSKMGPTFISIIAVVLLAVVHVDDKPVLDLTNALKNGVAWGVIFLVGAAVLLGGAITKESVGLTAFIVDNIVPIVSGLSTFKVVLFIAFLTSMMTNFSSNVTTVIMMTTSGILIAKGIPGLDGRLIAMVTTFTAALAYCIPSSFACIAVLYGDEYSKGSVIFKYGVVAIFITTLAATVGYYLISLIS